MPILLTRIDNRLIHGQVGMTWVMTLQSNLVVVVDDDVAEDPLQQQLMASVLQTSGAGVRFFSIEKMINVIHKASDRQKIFIVVPTPEVAWKLIEGGVPIEEVNIGNMHFSKGKTQLSKKVYVDETDLDYLHKIRDYGVELYIQDVPGDSKEFIK
ncbi:PTS galactosamine transporter subunit IIB [Pasteurella atlantica]|uniref:PTS galactosamine transporter subunit IIB n=4 Tax=Pasteurellaceae TaxID=712 RepID=A0A1H7V407_9PAST|nr:MULTISPECIES: PTS galactosamine transporter subunit IIB [Pasteurella]MBR0574280.1 PTS N-acetylgalactosamine transporter subunit IIB [Pasteurella atlantica]MDP8032856.1 PTS galactosamine transporter subunit IIB [Pasteurella atlantica]MDP8034638.1 PTS galactosamine transporter subunit IIB [Pasteurella atlantica]MDP8036588.1 PTS galactosamine transporter subunit IIB [Pasteurella atlantica]MDP8040184.1 PTS galactosamine transporter subunit IIB [Pasteurella atlantica]